MARGNVSRRKNPASNYRGAIFSCDDPVVYFVGNTANDLVKIGRSTEFRMRFMRMASQSPVPLIVYGVLACSSVGQSAKVEKAVHTMLTRANRHSHGEWFRIPISGVGDLARRLSSFGGRFIAADYESEIVTGDEQRPESGFAKAAHPRYEISTPAV